MSGVHYGHDGRKYFSLKARNDADKIFDQTNAGRRGKGNSHTPHGVEWTDQEWEDWKAQWKSASWDKKPAPINAGQFSQPADGTLADGSLVITVRHGCDRFS